MARRNPRKVASSTGTLAEMHAVIEEHGGGEVVFEAILLWDGTSKSMMLTKWPEGANLSDDVRASMAMNLMELLAESVADTTSVKILRRTFRRMARTISRLGWLHNRIAPR